MSDRVFVIAECGSSWRFGDDHLANAYRMIEAAKGCGADAVKFQWCSSAKELAARRGEPQYEKDYEYVEYDRVWLSMLKAKAIAVGIEFMCTAFLPQDVSVVAPLVKRFKVAAKEAMDHELAEALPSDDREVIVSCNPGVIPHYFGGNIITLHCISRYPCPLDEIWLRGRASVEHGPNGLPERDGLSDHTGHVLTGAVAVGAGARVIEVHCKLNDTPEDNPDFPHSHFMECAYGTHGGVDVCDCLEHQAPLKTYIQNVRTAERMVG